MIGCGTPDFAPDGSDLTTAVNNWLQTDSSGAAGQTYGHISQWCTTGVTDMSGLFFSPVFSSFNEDINGWDVSSGKSGLRNVNCPSIQLTIFSSLFQ